MTFSTLRLHGSLRASSVGSGFNQFSGNYSQLSFLTLPKAHYGHWRIPYVLNAKAYKNFGSMTISCLLQGTSGMLDLFACEDKDEEDSDIVT